MSSSSSSDSGLVSFLFYTFFVYPSCSWILAPGRFPRKTAVMYAVAFLALLASLKTGAEVYERGGNHYTALGVNRSSTAIEIKKAYKRMSLELHPDKNPSPMAAEQFSKLKESYDVLMDVQNRVVYNKFGQDGIKNNKSHLDESTMLLEMGVFYATWGMLAYILTLGKSSSNARNWIFTGLISMILLEVTLMTTEEPLPDWFFPSTTEYEWVLLLHSLFPAFLNGCRCLGSFLYVDLDQKTTNLLLALHDQNKDVLLVLRDLQIQVHNVQAGRSSRDKLAPAGQEALSVDGAALSSTSNATSFEATPTGKLRELQHRLKKNNDTVSAAVGALKTEGSKGSGMGFYLMIIGYVALSYAFQ